MKLETLDSIARQLVQGVGNGKAQWPHGRDPAQTKTHRSPHFTQLNGLIVPPHIARIAEGVQTQGFVIASAGEWEHEFGIQIDFLRPARDGAGDVARAKAALLKATHRAQPPP